MIIKKTLAHKGLVPFLVPEQVPETGFVMAAKRRHWKEKNGRFWARIAIPKDLQPCFDGKTQLTEQLGGDLRIADRNHAAAVARLQARIDSARRDVADAAAVGKVGTATNPAAGKVAADAPLRTLTDADVEKAVWQTYTSARDEYATRRAALPTPRDIEEEREKVFARLAEGEVDVNSPASVFNLYTDFELKAAARMHDANLRARKLAALRQGFATGETRLVDDSVTQFVRMNHLAVEHGSPEWQDLAEGIMRAQIQALEHSIERDNGVFGGTPTDPLVRPPTKAKSVSMQGLFRDYISHAQTIGNHLDGGKAWKPPIDSLIRFLGHDDAHRITQSDLLRWRDFLLAEGLSPKTVADKYLAAVRAVLTWAVTDLRLPTNPMEKVRQRAPKKVKSREKGFTTPEALRILTASLTYKPVENSNPSNRESAHITATKRWVPLLCAFTGARVTELTQLRKQDVREEAGRWILRITPEAGSVKSGDYRDVPLHRQVIELGFIDFVTRADAGPLFHRGTTPGTSLKNARLSSGRLSQWLQDQGLIPQGVQPSHGWRHRFKTQGRELGMSDRVLDAIQGHSGKTAADDYGDVTTAAKLRLIDALPHYDLNIEQPAETDGHAMGD
ncbi:tyrosine-type recombinase/integrase [Rhodovulum strictum]|uniref:Tyrosine-type recombinase/integrase n=1 Tax=Rhodovulum strictum TaxID=58314 RepID=A0A844BSG7_9RHOB|nr:tyrosine-type recombinase/integrase [Rhodovulum strictum]MRH22877.1 tyrosine-type recombinase/integrase [Rhodovulum strictum]